MVRNSIVKKWLSSSWRTSSRKRQKWGWMGLMKIRIRTLFCSRQWISASLGLHSASVLSVSSRSLAVSSHTWCSSLPKSRGRLRFSSKDLPVCLLSPPTEGSFSSSRQGRPRSTRVLSQFFHRVWSLGFSPALGSKGSKSLACWESSTHCHWDLPQGRGSQSLSKRRSRCP